MNNMIDPLEIKVDVYFNLHKHKLSIRSRENDKYGYVIGHKRHVVMRDVSFIVNEKGRQRVLKERRKNVHAYVRGTMIKSPPASGPYKHCIVSYNPYKAPYFYNKETSRPIKSALFVFIMDKEIVALTKKDERYFVRFAHPNDKVSSKKWTTKSNLCYDEVYNLNNKWS